MTTLIIITATVVLLLTLLGLSVRMPRHITKPKQKWYYHVLDWVIYPYTKLSHGKISAHWHWKTLSSESFGNLPPGLALLVNGDAKAVKAKSKLGLLFAHLLGWKECAILSPENLFLPWRLAFSSKGNNEYCTIKVNGAIRVLIGPDDVYFWGLSENETPVLLVLVGRYRINNTKIQEIPLI